MSTASSPEKYRRRVVLFGGQGSRSQSSSSTVSAIEDDITTSPSVSILLSKCHVAFLEEISSLDQGSTQSLGLDLPRFNTVSSLLPKEGEYSDHALIQATTLCLYQLLHYLAEVERRNATFDKLFDQISETTGFCAGLIPAAVVASSRNVEEYTTFAIEAFRLTFWIGYRAMMRSINLTEGQTGDETWSLVISGAKRSEVEDCLAEANARGTVQTLHVSALSDPNRISISGPPHDLAVFKGLLGAQTASSFAHVHAWYHGGSQLEDTILQVERDIADRRIKFPSTSDIWKPLRSPHDASFFDAGLDTVRLDMWVTRHILVHSMNWSAAIQHLIQDAYQALKDEKSMAIQLESLGPSTQFLLAGVRLHPDHPGLQVLDLSPFTSARKRVKDFGGQEGIAIVGMGLDLPKGKGPEELWQTISNGLCAIQEIPESRFNLSDHFTADETAKPRSMHARHGAFLHDIWTFDNTFFSISPREAMSMDPQQRLLLHTTQAALDDAGYVQDSTPSFQRRSMGCYIGLATGDYTNNLHHEIDAFYIPGTLRAFHSGRLSYTYKFSGPCLTIDTACSSSLVSIYQACRALQNGDCTSALAGGVNAICSPDMYLGLDKGHFLSSSGGCKSFDASADGYSRAEGSVVFVLKRLSDAVAENDRIHGIIKDAVVNQSGNARSITHPHSETQVDLYRNLLIRSGIQPSSISVVEAHGTGTQAGDTREISGLQMVFAEHHSASDPLLISSIKGNIGHCEAASGAAGLAKLLLMLRHGIVPKQASLTTLNPKITGLEGGHLRIPVEAHTWRRSKHRPRRAMLNNFGAAGSNAALILEEPTEVQKIDTQKDTRSSYVFCISAKTQESLLESITEHQEFLDKASNVSLADIAYTATARRRLYEYRFATAVSSIDELKTRLNRFSVTDIAQTNVRGVVVFVFSGQGSIHAGMGKELMQTSTFFREHVILCDTIVRSLGYPSILTHFDDTLATNPDGLDDVIASQCACVALEYGLGMLLMSWNVIPSYTMGHSLGEYAALTISGALSIKDTMRIVASRAKLMTAHCPLKASGMVACKLRATEADAMLRGNENLSGLVVACRNSTVDCVISGPVEKLAQLERNCEEKKIKSRRLDVPYGFHSPSMDPIMRPLEELGSSVHWAKPTIPVMSTVFGRLISSDQDFASDYLALHARQPVLFEDCMNAFESQGILDEALCVEVGPHPISLPMIRSMVASESCSYVPTLQKGVAGWKSLSATLCQLVPLTDKINWRAVFELSQARMTDLPAYPLRGKPFKVPYKEDHPTIEDGDLDPSASYPDTGLKLLPKMIPALYGHSFQTSTDLLGPLILGHDVGGTAICPASVFLELALEASRAVLDLAPSDVLIATEVKFANPLTYAPSDDAKKVRVHISDKPQSEPVTFRITVVDSQTSDESLCCSGAVTIKDAQDLESRWVRDAAIVRRQKEYLLGNKHNPTSRFQKRVLYDVVFTRVVKYSREYQSLSELSISESSLEGIGTFKVPNVSEAAYQPDVFIRWCDVLLHSAGCIANMTIGQEEIGICALVDSVEILYDKIDFNDTFTVYCSLIDAVKGAIIADAFAINTSGEVVGIIRGMAFKRLRLSTLQHILKPRPSPKTTATESQLSKTMVISSPLSISPVSSVKAPEASTPPVKQTLTQILCEISGLQVQDLVYSNSLEALGIDSMMQIEMTIKLRQAFPGKDLDHNVLSVCENLYALEATISSILGATTNNTPDNAQSGFNTPASLDQSGSTSNASSTASLQSSVSDDTPAEGAQMNSTTIHSSSSHHSPLYLFHDGSGMVSQYSGIQDLGRTLHAFFDPYFFTPKRQFSTIQEMAARYTSYLTVSKTPSMILGGWSFGGVVALEAAQQLTKRGFEVKGLVLIDAPFPIDHQPLPDTIITHFVNNAALIDEFRKNANLLGKYKPPTDAIPNFKVAILRSQDTIDTERICDIKYDWLSNQEIRTSTIASWNKLLGTQAKVWPIPGNHFEPFAPGHVVQTSAQLRAACEFIEEGR